MYKYKTKTHLLTAATANKCVVEICVKHNTKSLNVSYHISTKLKSHILAKKNNIAKVQWKEGKSYEENSKTTSIHRRWI